MDELVYSRRLMRFLLALFAVLALTVNPVTAGVAGAGCDRTGPIAMAGMAMSSVDQSRAAQTADPCCNHGDAHKHKANNCGQICAAACAVAAALPASSASIACGVERVTVIPTQPTLARAHEPSGPERPPKSMS